VQAGALQLSKSLFLNDHYPVISFGEIYHPTKSFSINSTKKCTMVCAQLSFCMAHIG